jgi:hypothetical protein
MWRIDPRLCNAPRASARCIASGERTDMELPQSFRNTIEAIQPVISAMKAVTSP